jgi:hypothetical protein
MPPKFGYTVLCHQCGKDLTKAVEMAAGDWSEGLPSTVLVWCDHCEDDIEFCIEWHHVLWSVTPVAAAAANGVTE